MNTVNTTIASEVSQPDEVAVPVQESKPAETVIEEGKTVGKPFADDPKFKLRDVDVFYGDTRAIKKSAWILPATKLLPLSGHPVAVSPPSCVA